MPELNIYQRLNAVMKAINYVKKDASITGAGAGYMAVTHDQVTAITRKHFIEAGIIIVPNLLRSEIVVKRDLAAKIPVKMMLYSGDYAIHFVNIDDPKDEAVVTVNAHANDNGDKAPGKALSYATKSAVLKILSLETGVNDESRTHEVELYRPEEKAELDRILEVGDSMAAVVMSQTLNAEVLGALNNSFEKGEVSKNKKILRELTTKGWGIFKETAAIVVNKGATEDNPEGDESTVKEVVGDLTPEEKRILAGMLEPADIDYLKEVMK